MELDIAVTEVQEVGEEVDTAVTEVHEVEHM